MARAAGFTPTYRVAMPKVNGSYFTSTSPCARIFAARAS